MARRRFFVESMQDGSAELRGEEAHHLGRVLRAEAGQQYEISDGSQIFLAEIESAAKDKVRFRLVKRLDNPPALRPLLLYMPLIKFDRFEWAIEKATELGASKVIPVECARSEAGLFEASVKRSERWRKIAKESAQQSRRIAPPQIGPACRVQSLRPPGIACRMEEQGACPLLAEILREQAEGVEIGLLVGPEGGWTEGERTTLDIAGWRRASLGSLVLRAETAALAALAIAGQYGS